MCHFSTLFFSFAFSSLMPPASVHQSPLRLPSRTPALLVMLFSRAERGYTLLLQTPCPSASLLLLFQVNHTTIFISRPGVVVALISCVCIKHPVGGISLCTALSIWGDGYQFLPQARVHQSRDPHYVFSRFSHSQQLKEGHKNLPGPGGSTLRSLHGGATTQCSEGYHARAPTN